MAAVSAPALAPGAATKHQKRLRNFLWFIAVISFLFILDYMRGGLFGDDHFRFVANSVSKDSLFVAVAVIGALNVPRYAGLCVPLLMLGHGILIVANIPLLFTDQDPVDMPLIGEVPARAFALTWMAIDAVIVAALFLFHRAAQRERLDLKYLGHLEYVSLRALADVLIHGDPEVVDPDRIARNVDGYLDRLKAPGKRLIRIVFMALSPFALLAPRTRRDVLEKLFVGAVERHRFPFRKYVRGAIRVAQQFVFLGYYGDRACHDAIGYKVFSKRRPKEDFTRTHVKTIRPEEVGEPDIVVVGSGAAGSILAHRLAGKHCDKRVLILERGPHIDPEAFKEDEVDMYLDLYNEGALQLARSFNFSVLQGMCVGGSTVINNAVCFRAPERVLDAWNGEFGAGIDRGALASSYESVWDWLGVTQADPAKCNPTGQYFVDGVEELGLPGEAHLVDVNIDSCRGCGYCNIGCSHGRKMSMLDKVLPEAQELYGEQVQVLPNCKVESIQMEGDSARGVVCSVGGRRLEIPAETVVVAAGAINSSVLLLNSGLRTEQAGRRLHFNIVSPLTARFPHPIRAYEGLQISHYWQPPADEARYVLETWFNPPATQALVMPGWFDDHFENMSAYASMGGGGVLVGTTTPGRVRVKKGMPEIDYTPGAEDMAQLVAGIKQLTRIFLAGGADHVMPATYTLHKLASEADLGVLDRYANGNDGLSLNSAHPQGGNAMSSDPTRGVVDPDFRVHGTRNVYVCDASVFPSSVTVNPQLTVMALAHYAADRIGQADAAPVALGLAA